MNKRIEVRDIMETVFDIVYLSIVIGLGIYFLSQAKTLEHPTTLILYGSMTLILGIGDSFHLIPRIFSNLSKYPSKWNSYLGLGKMITSITMTIFYVVLFWVWKYIYPTYHIPVFLDYIVSGVALLRIFLCLLPQNKWAENKDEAPWPTIRNLPFYILGSIVVILYAYSAIKMHDGFRFMPIAITLSFLFYIPVTIYAKRYPKVGMLMICKTIMYIWIVTMGFNLL
ncbi:MAG: hypothetical protein RR766_00535 [Longicatena sp.]